MTTKFSKLVLAASLLLAGASAMAEQTIGVQTTGSAVATARVNVKVIVPKIVILRVGDANATLSDVTFTVGATGAPATPLTGNSLAYTGTVAPALTASVATVNPVTTAGVLTVTAWTNNATGATLACGLSGTGGATTALATGATTTIPGTASITVTGATVTHPGANLSLCATATPTAIPALTAQIGTFTYAATFAATGVTAGSYGTTVTYTATAL